MLRSEAVIAGLIITGLGVGTCLIGSITSAQNALIASDIGSGTGALLVLRSVGGASASSLAGAIIASGIVATKRAGGSTAFSSTHSLHLGSAAMDYATQTGATAIPLIWARHSGWCTPEPRWLRRSRLL
jgi:hypothetical protein